MSAVTWPQVVIAVVAAASLILSLYNLWERRREGKPKLRVESGFVIAPVGGPYTSFTISNPGKVNVFVSQLYLEVGNQRMFFPGLEGNRSLPCKVVPGEAVVFWQETNPFYEKLRSVGFSGEQSFPLVAEDALGNRYTHTLEINSDYLYPEE